MAYIGSTPTTQSFIAGTDYFNGTGSQVAFTLSRSVNSVNDIEVIVNNVEQIPSGYSVSGTTLTFSAAPSAGTSNVYVRYLSTTNLSLAIPAGTSATFNTVTATAVNTTNLTTTNGTTIQGLTVGRGAGAVATNTAVGASALQANTSGSFNNAVGYLAGYSNTTGTRNNAFGPGALYANTTGANNTAIGDNALSSNTTAGNNTAVGYQAGYTNNLAQFNTFIGDQAGYTSSAGAGSGYNTFVGSAAGKLVTTGAFNTFVGAKSFNGTGSGEAVTTGSKNTILGGFSGNQGGLDIRTASNYIVLSDGDGAVRMFASPTYVNLGGAGSADTSLVYSYGTYNYTSGGAANMGINSSGFMYRSTSSLKYKKNVQDATHGLAEVLQLRPVTYESKQEAEAGNVYGGLIAEEVHEAGLTEFVQYAEDGTPDALAYSNMVSLCIKAIQEQQTLITALTARITALESK